MGKIAFSDEQGREISCSEFFGRLEKGRLERLAGQISAHVDRLLMGGKSMCSNPKSKPRKPRK